MGVLGGAIVGGMLGGGLGPVFGAISGGGALNFIGTSFKTLGIAAKAGVVLGGAAGAAGTWSVGQKLGEVAGKTVAFVPGFAAGAIGALGKKAEEMATGENGGDVVQPKPNKPSKPPVKQDLNQMSGIGKTVAAGVGGFGLLAGGMGGFVAGDPWNNLDPILDPEEREGRGFDPSLLMTETQPGQFSYRFVVQ